MVLASYTASLKLSVYESLEPAPRSEQAADAKVITASRDLKVLDELFNLYETYVAHGFIPQKAKHSTPFYGTS